LLRIFSATHTFSRGSGAASLLPAPQLSAIASAGAGHPQSRTVAVLHVAPLAPPRALQGTRFVEEAFSEVRQKKFQKLAHLGDTLAPLK
jgi:hypothetical protein